MPLVVNGPAWLLLRAVIGFGCAVLFVTTEGWLNAKAAAAERGRILSIYRVGIFIALAVDQILISQVHVEGFAAFNIIVAMFAMALALVCLTPAEPPQITRASALPYGQLGRAAPVAVAGVAITGLIVGAFYALVPAWMQQRGNDRTTIGLASSDCMCLPHLCTGSSIATSSCSGCWDNRPGASIVRLPTVKWFTDRGR